MLLRDLVEKNRYNFIQRASSWQDSIRQGCKPLEADGTLETSYAQEIIDCVEKHGPYIVIIPGVAIPHAMEGARGVKQTAISLMKVEEPVVFDETDPEKQANIFFTLACVNTHEHLKNMKQLFKMLTNEDLVEDLLRAGSPEDLLRLDEKYFH